MTCGKNQRCTLCPAERPFRQGSSYVSPEPSAYESSGPRVVLCAGCLERATVRVAPAEEIDP